jgi:hypothetical protein
MKTRKIGGNCCRYEEYSTKNDPTCNPNNKYNCIYKNNDTFHFDLQFDITLATGSIYHFDVGRHALKHIEDFNLRCVDTDGIQTLITNYFFSGNYAKLETENINRLAISTLESIDKLVNRPKVAKGNLVSLFSYPTSPTKPDRPACFIFHKKTEDERTVIYIDMIKMLRKYIKITDMVIVPPFYDYPVSTNTIDYTDVSMTNPVVETVKKNEQNMDKEYDRVIADYIKKNPVVSKMCVLDKSKETDEEFISRLKTMFASQYFAKYFKQIKEPISLKRMKKELTGLTGDDTVKLNLLISESKKNEGTEAQHSKVEEPEGVEEHVEEQGKELTGDELTLNKDEILLNTRKIDAEFLNYFVPIHQAFINDFDRMEKILAVMKQNNISDHDSKIILGWLMVRPEKLSFHLLQFIMSHYYGGGVRKRDMLEQILSEQLLSDDISKNDIREFLDWFFYRIDDDINFVEAHAQLAPTEPPEPHAPAEGSEKQLFHKTLTEFLKGKQYKPGNIYMGVDIQKLKPEKLKRITIKDIEYLNELTTSSRFDEKKLFKFISDKFILKGGTRRRNKRTRRRRTLKFR